MQQSLTSPLTTMTPVPSPNTGKSLQGDLLVLWDVFKRGWKLVLFSVVVCLTLATLYLAKTQRSYQASTRLMVIQHGSRPISVINNVNVDGGRPIDGLEDPVPTHMVLIRSPLVVSEAIKSIDRTKCPALFEAVDPLAHAILSLKVQRPDRLTKIISLDYVSPSRDESYHMVNAIVRSYKKLLESNYQQTNQEVISLIRKARDEIERDLIAQEKAYYDFKEKNPGFGDTENRRMIMARGLEQWNQRINNTTDAIIRLQSQLTLAKRMQDEGVRGMSINEAMLHFNGLGGVANPLVGTKNEASEGSLEQLQNELATVELRRKTAERLVENLRQDRPDVKAKVTDEDIAGEFRADERVAELYKDLDKIDVRYSIAKRTTRNPNDPSLVFLLRQKHQIESRISGLWSMQKPAIMQRMRRAMTDDVDVEVQKAEAELAKFVAQEKSLRVTLAEAKEKEIQSLQMRHAQLAQTQGVNAAQTLEVKAQLDRATEEQRNPAKLKVQSDVRDKLASLEHMKNSFEGMRVEYEDKLKTHVEQARASELDRLQEEKLHGNVERQKNLYNTVLDQLKQAQLVSDYNSIACQVVDPPTALKYPVHPRIKLTLALAICGGVFVGMGLALLIDRFDQRIRTVDEVRRTLNFAMMGTIPKLPPDQAPVIGEIGLVCHALPRSVWAEAYRSVRTSVEFLRRNRQIQAILVTSAHSGDGKTTTATNLAISFAMAGRKVLLVDADLRKPSQHKILGLKREQGLSHVLKKLLPLSRVVQPTMTEHLDFVASGPEVDNPAELLASTGLSDFVTEARGIYDIIVFDSSPLLAVTDPSILSASVDGIVLVVRPEATRRHDAERTVELLKTMESPVLGFIVNGMERQHSGYGYGYGQGYGYGYGYGYGTYGVQERVENNGQNGPDLGPPEPAMRPTHGLPNGFRKG